MISPNSYSTSPETLAVIAEFMFAVASSKRGLDGIVTSQIGPDCFEQSLPETGHKLRMWAENGEICAELTIQRKRREA